MQLGRTRQPGRVKPPLVHAVKRSREISHSSQTGLHYWQCEWFCGNISSRSEVWEGEADEITCSRCREKVSEALSAL